MKLLTIANRYYLITLVLVFFAGSIAAYSILKSIINHEFNEKLYAEQEQLIYELKNYENLQQTYYLNIGDVIELRETAQNLHLLTQLKDTVMFDKYENKNLPFRTLTFSAEINEKFYKITITKSLLPNQDLIEGISEIMLGIAIALILALGLLNRIIFKNLWAPFHQIITQLKQFQISNHHPFYIAHSKVDEFNHLGEVLDKMITKSTEDYDKLKEYTENTSHEIQTPLAIIKNKAEMLLQDPLPEHQLQHVSRIYEAARRLSRLKEGLSLLTKIDNNQFVSSEKIPLQEFIQKKLTDFEELILLKRITVETKYVNPPSLDLNIDLAHIMMTNLLSNAIKHNVEGGKIWIHLTSMYLSIKNTGNEPTSPTSTLFARFKKSGNNQESTGLGLSLIQLIARQYHMRIKYTYENGKHHLLISF